MTRESTLQDAIRAEASRYNVFLWRNNSGVLPNPMTGVPIRFGLANDSARINAKLKSGDLIGWCGMLHRTPGRFVSIECKAPGWRGPRTDREHAQAAWITLVRENGGIAGFVTSLEELRELIR